MQEVRTTNTVNSPDMRKWFREPWSPPTEEYYAAINKDEGADTYSPQRECEKLCTMGSHLCNTPTEENIKNVFQEV